jgi:hypothetical protein
VTEGKVPPHKTGWGAKFEVFEINIKLGKEIIAQRIKR